VGNKFPDYFIQHQLFFMNIKQSLHSLLADNETAEVIKQLRSITEADLTPLKDEVEQISTRFQQNIENSHHELSDEATINRENSSIRYALFSVINRLPEDAILPADLQAKRLKIAAFMIFGVALFALIGFNYSDFFNKETPKTVVKPVAIEPTTAVSTPVVAPVAPVEAPAAPVVAPVTPVQTPQIVVDSVPKVDTLRKKKVRRIKKVAPVIGDTFKVN
jgi:hypothetical protein